MKKWRVTKIQALKEEHFGALFYVNFYVHGLQSKCFDRTLGNIRNTFGYCF